MPKTLNKTLSPLSFDRLMNARKELGEILDLSPGLDIGSNKHNSELHYRPAYLRYMGNVYISGQIASLYPKTDSLQVLIISALYGLLDANDLIRDYDVAMNDSLTQRSMLKTWWKHKGLGGIVEEYIQVVNPSQIHDLLSGDYRDALKPWPPKAIRHKMLPYNYPGQGIGANWNRGKDLKRILLSHIRN